MENTDSSLCKLHTMRTSQMGSSLLCTSSASICETKGCIKHHVEGEKSHNIWTIKEIENIAFEFKTKNEKKRNELNKLVFEYFQVLKAEVEAIYHHISSILEKFNFESLIMDEKEIFLTHLLISANYNELSCSDIALILPKIIKCCNMEENQYSHFKDFINFEKKSLEKTLNSIILNLPYFRQSKNITVLSNFCEISDESIVNINEKLSKLSYKPKQVRIKYVEDDKEQQEKVFNYTHRKSFESYETHETVEEILRWDIHEEKFQVNFFEALLALPFIISITVYTGYKVTTTAYLEELVEGKPVEIKIYKKDWHF